VPAPLFLAPHRATAPCSARPDIPLRGWASIPRPLPISRPSKICELLALARTPLWAVCYARYVGEPRRSVRRKVTNKHGPQVGWLAGWWRGC